MTWNDYVKECGQTEYNAWERIASEIRNNALEEAALLVLEKGGGRIIQNRHEFASRIRALKSSTENGQESTKQ